MSNAITMGIFWHLIGAASAACFYAPFKKVKKWSWETMWSVGGIVSWIILPWAISALLLPNFWAYYSSFSLSTLLPVFLFGAMWGIGNINYGLTMRYLGMSMGIGIAIGITLIVGTLMTPIINGNFDVLINTEGGRMTLLGVLVALIGVGIVTRAGQLKERKMGIKAEEFNLKKGLVLAVMCGIFSAGMSFAMNAAKPMHEAAAALGVDPLYVALPSYVIIMGGGAIINLGFCFIRLAKVKDLSLKADFSLAKPLIIHNVLLSEEFNLKKGLVLAVMCGIFSAGMSFAMNAAKPMHEAAAALGVDPLYVALPSYVIIMGGGAIINLGFCFIRLAKVKDLSLKADFSLAKPLITHNVLLSALGGLMWYLQFFFYAWGHARIPAQYDYISWMLHMSFYVLCGGIVGLVLKEWNNAGRRPVTVLSLGCVVIIVAANIVGIGMAN
ncbi:L-rhamnose/proton symporter RhaT [Escherichia coli]|nr:L-rhamnose/proton symporter RhaT [Escherichia coli]